MNEELDFSGTWKAKDEKLMDVAYYFRQPPMNRIEIHVFESYPNHDKIWYGWIRNTCYMLLWDINGKCISDTDNYDLNERIRPALLAYA